MIKSAIGKTANFGFAEKLITRGNKKVFRALVKFSSPTFRNPEYAPVDYTYIIRDVEILPEFSQRMASHTICPRSLVIF